MKAQMMKTSARTAVNTKAWLGVVAMVLLIVGTLYQVNQGQSYFLVNWVQQLPYGDKLGHLGIFGALMFVLNLAMNGKTWVIGQSQQNGVRINLALLLIGAFAVIEEFSQLFIVSRNFDLLDLLCDALGLGLGYGVSKRVLEN